MELFSPQSLLFFLSLCLFYCIATLQKRPTKYGFKIYPIIGALPGYLKNRHRFLEWTTETLRRCPTKTAVFRRPGNVRGVHTANPLNVEHILKTNFENYPKGDRSATILGDFLGQGIFNSDGDTWKVQRKTASYEFNTKSLRNFVMDNVKSEIQSRLVPILAKASRTEQILDLQDILERFAFDNICKVAFNVDPKCLNEDGTYGAESFMRAFEEAATLSSSRFRYAFPFFWKIKKFFNLGSEKLLKESISTVHDFADQIIQSRMEQRTQKTEDDLLSRFVEGHKNSPRFLRDIVTSFILAGRDTTSSALTWFFWLLSVNPQVQQKILNELQSIRNQNGKNIGDSYGFDELRDMHYLHAAISESLRLYPPVPVDTKACANDDILPDGTFIGKGWFETYHMYAMGRMESLWGENWSEYMPERWLENGIYLPESSFRFPVFHAGPRICLGKDMAYNQMKSIAASVIERFEVEPQQKTTCPEHVLSLTMRMKDGLKVRVRERCVDVLK